MPSQSRDLERRHLWKPKPVRTLTPPDPPLQDDVVLLRPPEPADADALLPIRSEEDTRRWMLWDDEPPPNHDEILANIERARRSWAEGTWAVFVITVDGEIVGGANLGFYDHDIAEGSYFLAGAERGKGYATRTLRLWRSGPSRRTGLSGSSSASTRATRDRSGWPGGSASRGRASSARRAARPTGLASTRSCSRCSRASSPSEAYAPPSRPKVRRRNRRRRRSSCSSLACRFASRRSIACSNSRRASAHRALVSGSIGFFGHRRLVRL